MKKVEEAAQTGIPEDASITSHLVPHKALVATFTKERGSVRN